MTSPEPATESGDASRARRRRLFRAVLAACASLLVAALAGEAVVRVAERRSFDSDARFVARRAYFRKLAWMFLPLRQETHTRMRPNARIEGQNPDGSPLVIVTSSRGFRAPEFDAHPTPGHPRVLCVGGSTTFMGPTNETTYPALVGKLLAPAHAEVLNLGISGMTSDDNRERFLGEYVHYEPAVVVALEGINDITFLHIDQRLGRTLPYLLARSRLLRLGVGLRPDEAKYRAMIRATTIANLELMRAAAEAHGARFVACTFAVPDFARLAPDERRYLEHDWAVFVLQLGPTLEDYGWMLGILNDEIRAWAKEHGLALADLAAELAHAGLESFEDCCHFTNAGRERQARTVARAIAPLLGIELPGR